MAARAALLKEAAEYRREAERGGLLSPSLSCASFTSHRRLAAFRIYLAGGEDDVSRQEDSDRGDADDKGGRDVRSGGGGDTHKGGGGDV